MDIAVEVAGAQDKAIAKKLMKYLTQPVMAQINISKLQTLLAILAIYTIGLQLKPVLKWMLLKQK